MTTMDTQLFIRNKFAEFYETNSVNIEVPKSLENREFGFVLFKERIMVRHKGFTTAEDLINFTKQTVPSHAYYSTAYYDMPEEKMEEKGWLGSDLYFDIDADHIPTACKKIHDSWICKNCGFAGKGTSPEKCPKCGNRRFDEKTWPCEVCLESAKLETMKLVDILTKDFGFSANEVDCSFSGHRGYHVHVDKKEIRELGSIARKEIVDYITGTGADTSFHIRYDRSKIITGPSLGDAGWSGRMARGTYGFLLSAKKEELKRIGLREKVSDEIIEKRDTILKSWETTGPWNLIKGVSAESWKAIAQRGVENQSARIDTVVTTDIHRLIRLPGSLHGKTGLLKVSFPTDNIEKFDPLKSAIAFKKGLATIYVEEAPQFRLGEEVFGPFKNQKAELPMAAALFLLCKDAAKVVE